MYPVADPGFPREGRQLPEGWGVRQELDGGGAHVPEATLGSTTGIIHSCDSNRGLKKIYMLITLLFQTNSPCF